MPRLARLGVLVCAGAVLAAAVDSNLLKLVMPEACVLAGLDAVTARSSPFGQFLLSQVSPEAEQDLQKFIAATGFDPRYHLSEILLAAPGVGHDQPPLVLAAGSFDVARILKTAKEAGLETEVYRGIEVLTGDARSRRGPAHQVSLAFPSNLLAIAGDSKSVHQAIDRRLDGGPGPDPKLAARAGTLSAANHAWFVSFVPVSEFAGGMPDGSGGPVRLDVFRAIEQGSGGVKFADPVLISGEIITRTPQDATSLADVLRFLVGLVRLNPRDEQAAALAALLSTLDLRAEANTVKLSLSIPEAQLEAAIRAAREQGRTRKPGPQRPAINRARPVREL